MKAAQTVFKVTASFTCKQCGNPFDAVVKSSYTPKYCSNTCSGLARRNEPKEYTCSNPACRLIFTRTRRTTIKNREKPVFCSVSCAGVVNVEAAKKWNIENPEESLERLKKLHEINKGNGVYQQLQTPEVRKKAQQGMDASPFFKPGKDHLASKVWRLRSSANVEYEFKNLTNFVREHPELFDPEDLKWKLNKNGIPLECRATHGLYSLNPNGKKKVVAGSWKGWTFVSMFERRFNDGDDLLQRNVK
jgi:hypothetical protein